MLPEPIGGDPCSLARRWTIAPVLAGGLVSLERRAEERFAARSLRWPGLWIIDGHRTIAHQAELNPDVTDSLHARCPSLAADLRVGSLPGFPGGSLLEFAGGLWMSMGFRWGGTFSDFPNPAHFDIGRL